MKKRLIVESLSIALLTVTLMSTIAFAAWPGPDSGYQVTYGSYGSWVSAAVAGYYCQYQPNEPSENYCKVNWGSCRGSNGYSETVGQMYYTWNMDGNIISGSTASDVAGYVYEAIISAASCYTSSEFEFYGMNWYLSAYGAIVGSDGQ